MKPSALHLYFLSGTGNALKAAEWIATEFRKKSIPATITSIDGKKGSIHRNKHNEAGMVGLCYPTHGFSLPWAMLKFIIALPKAEKGERFFLLNTRAGTRIYKAILPGASGIAQILPLLIMLYKGYELTALLPLDMPSNWISLHPGMPNWVYSPIVAHCENQTRKFAERLTRGKRYFHAYVFVFLPLDLMLIPISIAYALIGRFFLAKTFFATNSCNGCRICVEKCPVTAIKMVGGRPYWTFSCESCMRCMNICPKKAIQTAHLFAVSLITLVIMLPLTGLLKGYINELLPFIPTSLDWLVSITTASAISLPIFFATYFGFHYILRFKWINKAFRYTSLTSYWRRYLAPNITLKDFKRNDTLGAEK